MAAVLGPQVALGVLVGALGEVVGRAQQEQVVEAVDEDAEKLFVVASESLGHPLDLVVPVAGLDGEAGLSREEGMNTSM